VISLTAIDCSRNNLLLSSYF